MSKIHLSEQPPMRINLVGSSTQNRAQQELKHVVQEFEAVFLDMLFKQMQRTIPRDGYLDSDSGTRLYEEMLYEELSKSISRAGGIGLGERLYENLVKYVSSWSPRSF
jgi:flagellar protein FlgJ